MDGGDCHKTMWIYSCHWTVHLKMVEMVTFTYTLSYFTTIKQLSIFINVSRQAYISQWFYPNYRPNTVLFLRESHELLHVAWILI